MASSFAGTHPSLSSIGASEVVENEQLGLGSNTNSHEINAYQDDKCRSGTSYEEKFQGPHKWRRQLRHVPSKRLNLKNSRQNKDTPEYCDEDGRTMVSLRHNKEHFDTGIDTAKAEFSNDTNNLRPNSCLSVPQIDDTTGLDQNSNGSLPPWSKDVMEKSNYRKLYKQTASSTGGQASQIPVTVRRRGSLHGVNESAFTRQVVNSGHSSSTARKKLSPSSSFRHTNPNLSAFPGRRTNSQQNIEVSTNTDLTKKRIERVQRARLYLLQQTGPNSFLIGGDSPDHKYRVIIGPQTCSCGRGPHCVHVLFVMLRVFQVGENNPCLWSKTLKNFEVENLFRIYHDKRSSRIKRRRLSQRKKSIVKEENDEGERGGETINGVSDSSRLPSESDTGSVREEEDTCPICLLEMLEGESLIRCENGCHNRLHHHCIAIWFEECRRQNDPLNCPLCRAQWKTTTVEIKSTQGGNNAGGLDVPPNTRTSSPQPSLSGDTTRLPHAEPIAPEHEEIAAPWVEALGLELVSCLLSRNWSIREAGLKHLSKEVMSTLMRGTGEGRPGAIVSPTRRAATHNMLQTTCNILAYTCADPVYRVFVASLRSIRTLLSYTPCRDAEQQARLQATLKPVVEAIILKCTDGNRRTSQLSLSTLVELVKGQEGELAVGKEIHNAGSEGLDGLNYVLKCVTEDYDLETVQWQWLLGRLYTIDRLLEEFPSDFLPRQEESQDAAGASEPNYLETDCGASASNPGRTRQRGQMPDRDDPTGEASSKYKRLMSVAHFSVKAVCSAHMRIARMSRRVFLLSAKLGAHVGEVVAELKDLLSQINSSSVASLGRKLDRIVEDFHLSERIVHELMHGSDGSKQGSNKTDDMSPPFYSPADSACSSPRCNSPVTATSTSSPSHQHNNHHHHHHHHLSDFINGETGPRCTSEKSAPVPPNTPNTQRAKRKLRRGIPRRNAKDILSGFTAPPSTSENSPEKSSEKPPAGEEVEYSAPPPVTERPATLCAAPRLSPMLTRLGSASPPNRRRSNLPLRRKTIEGDKVAKRAGSSSPTIRRRTVDGSAIPSSNIPQPHTQTISRASASPARTPPSTLAIFPDPPTISVTNVSPQLSDINVPGSFSPAILSDLDENTKESGEEVDTNGNKSCERISSSPLFGNLNSSVEKENEKTEDSSPGYSEAAAESPLSSKQSDPITSTPCCCCNCHRVESKCVGTSGPEDFEVTFSPSTPQSGTAGLPNTPESGRKNGRRRESVHYHTSEHESMSSDDFLEFSSQEGGGTGDQSIDDKPVSFRTEVANSPKSSPSHSVHSGASSKSGGGDCGTCKEEVEREEAEALAQALAVSERQDPCPVVPGLTPTSREEVITIRIQPDTEEEDGSDPSTSSTRRSEPSMYMEKIHWMKGPLLGTGAYSTCYQARDVRTGVIMAVKQISFCRNSPQEQEKVVEAITEEIHMMAKLSHPNVVRILGATKQGCHFNMFVEWMPGGSMAYLLGEYGSFTENVIVNYTRQILKGLAYLHDNHVLHRDLKGANLLIDSTGQILRIGDFGASARLASHATGAGEFQGQLLGTIAFMAPEVLRGESYGRACDVWSVGCVMIEMATTKPPWNATDVSNHLALIYKIASSIHSPPIPENLPPPVRDLMLRCLEQKSEDRPSAQDLLLHPLFTQCFPPARSNRSRTGPR